jgi:hypothetical protein
MRWFARWTRSGPHIDSSAQPELAGRGEIYVEFVVQGNSVKVTAVDSASGTEACIVGPASAPQAALKAAVVRKLDYVLKKQNGGA